jgi:hypothetical protein
MPERRRKYTVEFKTEAAKMVVETGLPIVEIAPGDHLIRACQQIGDQRDELDCLARDESVDAVLALPVRLAFWRPKVISTAQIAAWADVAGKTARLWPSLVSNQWVLVTDPPRERSAPSHGSSPTIKTASGSPGHPRTWRADH